MGWYAGLCGVGQFQLENHEEDPAREKMFYVMKITHLHMLIQELKRATERFHSGLKEYYQSMKMTDKFPYLGYR